jgi:hypothetical protein
MLTTATATCTVMMNVNTVSTGHERRLFGSAW